MSPFPCSSPPHLLLFRNRTDFRSRIFSSFQICLVCSFDFDFFSSLEVNLTFFQLTLVFSNIEGIAFTCSRSFLISPLKQGTFAPKRHTENCQAFQRSRMILFLPFRLPNPPNSPRRVFNSLCPLPFSNYCGMRNHGPNSQTTGIPPPPIF